MHAQAQFLSRSNRIGSSATETLAPRVNGEESTPAEGSKFVQEVQPLFQQLMTPLLFNALTAIILAPRAAVTLPQVHAHLAMERILVSSTSLKVVTVPRH